MTCKLFSVAVGVAAVGAAAPVRADGRLIDDRTFAVSSRGPLEVGAALALASPAALPSGLSTGVAATATRRLDCRWAVGGRAAWTSVTESSLAWTVRHDDLRLQALVALRQTAGRGTVSLRLAAGAVVVHEDRARNQAAREGRTDLDTTALAALPMIDLDVAMALHVAGPWLATVSAGPSVDRHDGAFDVGWTASLGVSWRP